MIRDYSFDDLGRLVGDSLTDATTTQVAGFSYTYDSELMESKTVTLAGNTQAGVHAYEYDRAGRLAEWDSPTGVVAYSWDGAGNRLGSGTDTYAYDDRNRLATGPEGAYEYSPRGTLETLTDGGTVTSYGFDSFGRLTDFDGTVAYTYDGLDRVATRDGAGFSYEGFSLDPTSDGAFTYGRSPGGRLISQTDGVTSLLAGLDAHGDLSYLTTTAGVVSDTAVYDPFGDPAASTGATSPTLGFQADFTDPVSEHVWMGARWYDGGWAAFLSRDTYFGELKTPISLNRYTYGHANPIRYFDPDGHAAEAAGGSGCSLSGCSQGPTTTSSSGSSGGTVDRWAGDGPEGDFGGWTEDSCAGDGPEITCSGGDPETASAASDWAQAQTYLRAGGGGGGSSWHRSTFLDGTPLPPDWQWLPVSEQVELMAAHRESTLGCALPFDRRANGCVGGPLVPEGMENVVGEQYEYTFIPAVEDVNEFSGRASLTLLACSAGLGGVCAGANAGVELVATVTDGVLAYDSCVADISYGGECLYDGFFAWIPVATQDTGRQMDEIAEGFATKLGVEMLPSPTRQTDGLIESAIFWLFDEFAPEFDGR